MIAENILKKEYNNATRRKLLSIMNLAYSNTERIQLSERGFYTERGKETLIYVRNLLVETQIKEAIDSHSLNMKYVECKNAADNCSHFEFETENTIMTVSRVNRKYALPRKAVYRENLSCNNGQISLFDEEENFKYKIHVLLTHVSNENNLSSIILGIPSANGKYWEASIDLLKELDIIVDNTNEEIPRNLYKTKKINENIM